MRFLIYSLMLFSFFMASPVVAVNKPETTGVEAKKNVKQDEEILGIVAAIDKNEIIEAKYVLKHHVDPAVKQYAEKLKSDHSQNLAEIMKLSKRIGHPMQSTDAKNVKKDGQKELADLKKLKGNEMQTAYINNMIKGHEAGLSLIDEQLIPRAVNPDVKTFLQNTRQVVEQHLKAAKGIQVK